MESEPTSGQFHRHGCYNFGFCLNEKTMLYKHNAALDFSEKIKDSIPSQTWYEEKWLNWTPETTNLEPASKHTRITFPRQNLMICQRT